jgi:GNAT superfamily N-acetyltransferase
MTGSARPTRDSGEIKWFLHWPEAPFWPDSADARDALLAACLTQLDRWEVSKQYADGTLPAPGVYGLPEQWPHVSAAYEAAGFVHEGHTEVVCVASVADLPAARSPPVEGLASQRSLGISGTRLSAVLGDAVAGFVEVEILDGAGRMPRNAGWADIGNLEVVETQRRHGIATWLVGQAADWLRLARVERVLGYALPEENDCTGILEAVGFRELTRTRRGWIRSPTGAPAGPAAPTSGAEAPGVAGRRPCS